MSLVSWLNMILVYPTSSNCVILFSMSNSTCSEEPAFQHNRSSFLHKVHYALSAYLETNIGNLSEGYEIGRPQLT